MAAQATVLLVEDDGLLRDTLEVALCRRGYRVMTAADGNAAMERSAEYMPEIAVIDMMLPGRSGFQVAQELKERSAGHVYIVMVSGNASPAHRDYALAAGVDRFLAKPFALSKLVEAVEGLPQTAPTARINGSGSSLIATS